MSVHVQQLPFQDLGDLATQIFEPPYETAQDIEAIAQFQITSTVGAIDGMITAMILTGMMSMMMKAMK